MGLFSHRSDKVEVRPEQKWDYISLRDFKSTSCFTPFAYIYLHFSLGLSIAVYAVDTFTAVQLLVFNRWSSEIRPTQLISFTASKWIFSICIILSFLNITYEHIRAQIIMRRGSVAESYLDNLAVRLESIRWGKGLGWKRFLVFAELTKSKKGTEYVALFTYFSFQSWIRVLLCSGPRQAVNALTLLSVYNAQLSVAGGKDVGNTLLDFFQKIRDLAENNTQEALILSGMIFTLIIWVFSFLSLLLAFCFFVFYLWHVIPRSDGGLSAYCSRKINKRLMKIVASKVNTAIAKEERRRNKAELKAAQEAGKLPPARATATIPNIVLDDKPPVGPGAPGNGFMLQRNDTMATLPPYTSRPGTSNSFELGNMDQKTPVPRPMPPARTGTMASMASTSGAPLKNEFSTRASLLNYAAEPGRSASPAPSMSMMRSNQDYGPPMARAMPTRANTGAPSVFGNNGPNNNNNYAGNNYAGSTYAGSTFGGNDYASNNYFENPAMSEASYYGNANGNVNGNANNYSRGHNPSGSGSSSRFMPYRGDNNMGRASPAPSMRSTATGNGGMGPGVEAGPGPRGAPPMRSATQPNYAVSRSITPNGDYNANDRGAPYGPPSRNMTAPVPAMGGNGNGSSYGNYGGPAHDRQMSHDSSYSSYFEQPSAAASQRNPPQRQPTYPNAGNNGRSSWNNDVEAQRYPQY